MAQVKKTERHENECRQCGEVSDVRVSVHELSGVAAFTCPECDYVQEPNPVDG